MIKVECLRKKNVLVFSCFVKNTINSEALKQVYYGTVSMNQEICMTQMDSRYFTQGVGQLWSHLSLGKNLNESSFRLLAEFHSL